MKKTYQMLITILSLIIMLTITGSAFAQGTCVIEWWTDECSWSECYMDIPNPNFPIPVWDCESGTCNPSGSITTLETSKTQAAALELFLTRFGTPQGFSDSDCYYYDYYQSPEWGYSSVCLAGTWSDFYYVGTPAYSASDNANGGWDVICEDGDIDGDGVFDSTDNCPSITNPNQADADNDTIGDACDDDIDGDEVLNDFDECEDTPVDEIVDPSNGCSIDQTCACDNEWKNHGAYVKCVAHISEDLVDTGLISETEKDDIVSDAAESECGSKK